MRAAPSVVLRATVDGDRSTHAPTGGNLYPFSRKKADFSLAREMRILWWIFRRLTHEMLCAARSTPRKTFNESPRNQHAKRYAPFFRGYFSMCLQYKLKILIEKSSAQRMRIGQPK